MADDQLLAELQHAVESIGPAPAPEASAERAPEPSFEELQQELERLASGHEERMRAILADYDAKRAALEQAIVARLAQESAMSKEAQIAQLKAEAGL